MTHPAPGLGLLLLQNGPGAMQSPLIPIILMVAVFYLVLFLPMRRRQKKLEEMLRNLKTGDRVMTTGGLLGVVTALTDKTVTLRIKPDNVKMEFSRGAVNALMEDEEKA
jgi:preprotein translocase subunit YajC